MKKKNDKPLSAHDKAIRLLEGGSVEIDSNWFRLATVNGKIDACNECKLDSICRINHGFVCMEVDDIDRDKDGCPRSHYLVLCSKNQ